MSHHHSKFVYWLGDHLLAAVLLVLLAILIGRVLSWIARRYRDKLDADVTAVVQSGALVTEASKRQRAVAQAIEWATVSLTYFLFGLLVLRQLGLPLTSLVAPATVAGVALGFGAQQVVGDLLAGFFLFTERQFGIGDVVRLSTPGATTGITGTVEELTLRVTKLRGQGGEVIVVPNSTLRQVTNLSRDWSQAVLDIPVPVDEDLDRATEIIEGQARQMAADEAWKDLIVGEPRMAGVESIEVGYVQLRLFVRTLPGRKDDVSRELNLRVVNALRNAGIKSPTITTNLPSNP